ncbi:cytochrome P450 [Zhihengliuella salsuginis]|uniref:Cytochrome P450 n=1 Tax=Zhihengliuella salsuginis TaxID=578222 RepID=A0ABQ3GBA4_9MICC|nr:cytochrome P450 [Zhihengliuella salsuginis]GHC99339.1 hypothetical protein GCM10008096_01380 [Zhihengliuella salsuginis]
MSTYHRVREPASVKDVLERTGEFEPTNALTAVVPLGPEALRILARVGFSLPPVLASETGAEHLRVRRMMAGFFSPGKVSAVTPAVRELARDAAAGVRARFDAGAHVDLAAGLADPVPPEIMSRLIGTGNPPLAELKRWSRDSLELFWGWPDEARQVELAKSAAEFYAWLRGSVRASRGTESLFGVLHAGGLDERRICSLGYFLVIAGQETTALLINTVLYRSLRDRGVWAACRDMDAARDQVRRVLATESSVHTWRRRVVADAVVDGVRLPAGAEILLELSGHHPAADGTGYGLAFGHGLHRCLGARLAELEAVVVLNEAARALPDAEGAGGDPPWLRLLSFQAPLTVGAAAPKLAGVGS